MADAATLTVTQLQLAYAVFALGRFIDYRLAEGMKREYLIEFMETYFQLLGQLEGREYLVDREQLSREVIAWQDLPPEIQMISPSWLPDDEKQTVHRRARSIAPCSDDLGIQSGSSSCPSPV